MNYLAHLALAQPQVPSKVGNLLGDFMRGVEPARLPGPVKRGLDNHRLVDRYTDGHPWVCQRRREFSPARRRFAGVALDVLFDHFLWCHWGRFHSGPVETAVSRYYADLYAGRDLMPSAMVQASERWRVYDVFNGYADLQTVAKVLTLLSQKLRFANDFAGIMGEIREQYDELEAGFLLFYPELQEAVRCAALERP